MNFFGHAALAARHFGDQQPPPVPEALAKLCLGAMLPDFIGMLRLGRPEIADAVLARGVAFHHKTDEAFHELPSFVGLSRRAFAWLSERDLPRGPARAIAHIGVEMLLDEAFALDAGARDAYRAALRVSLDHLLTFPAAADVARLSSLQTTLLERAGSALGVDPEVVAERIRRTLAGRPRLATDASAQELLTLWVSTTRPLVAAEAPEVFANLRLLLANFVGPK